MLRTASIMAVVVAGTAASANGQIRVTFENLQSDGGFFFTPAWVGVHDGSFDSYDGGTLASGWPGLTPLAEDGDTGPISAAFAAATGGVGVDGTLTGSVGHPTLGPGESGSLTLDPGDSSINRYFSYASMIIPSNDLFVANGNPLAHEVFDAAGNFNGPITIDIFGRSINDNGSEVNDAFGGAAFSANGGISVDENVVIRNFFEGASLDPDRLYLASFVGSSTVTGELINRPFEPDQLIGRITIVPAPASAAVLGLGSLLLGRRRRV